MQCSATRGSNRTSRDVHMNGTQHETRRVCFMNRCASCMDIQKVDCAELCAFLQSKSQSQTNCVKKKKLSGRQDRNVPSQKKILRGATPVMRKPVNPGQDSVAGVQFATAEENWTRSSHHGQESTHSRGVALTRPTLEALAVLLSLKLFFGDVPGDGRRGRLTVAMSRP